MRIEIRLAADFQACHEVLEAEIETLHHDLPVNGIPRVKVVRGAAGRSALTTVMEVETLYWRRDVWERGTQAFASAGRLAAFMAGVPFTAAQADLSFDDARLAPHGGDAGRGALEVLHEKDGALVERL